MGENAAARSREVNDGLQLLELLGQGAFGKVYRGACAGCWAYRTRTILLSYRVWRVQQAIANSSVAQPCFFWYELLLNYISRAGLWHGTVVAIKNMILPSKMSGAEKRARMVRF